MQGKSGNGNCERLSLIIELVSILSSPMLEQVRTLFREYQQSLGIDLSFQAFDEELNTLPGQYKPPEGRIYLALVDGKLAGCIALRPFAGKHCEMKRLYVRTEFRGKGVGKRLAQKAISDAKSIGYLEMFLDTLPTMAAAQKLYSSLGFQECPPYRHNPIQGTKYMKLVLAGTGQDADKIWNKNTAP
jgi:ribosomal protein S18 acetylase RimI-like enzyme